MYGDSRAECPKEVFFLTNVFLLGEMFHRMRMKEKEWVMKTMIRSSLKNFKEYGPFLVAVASLINCYSLFRRGSCEDALYMYIQLES